MTRLALKIDVDTYRGTLIGVPRLVELLRQHNAQATFLFSLGPDHTGRAIKRAFRPGFMKKVSRTSVVEHYGLRTLMYGTMLPGPDIGRKCADIMRGVRWQDNVETADPAWTEHEMSAARDRFHEVFRTPARTHGAAGWQMNAHALRLTQRYDFAYASDTRGTHPFLPVHNAEIINCPQLPTTLPTLDELIGVDAISAENVHEVLLAKTRQPPKHDHVYTLHAELEGMKLAPIFERLLQGWNEQGYSLTSTADIHATLDLATLPRHEVIRGQLPGRSGTLMLQGAEFLAN
jgi:undecaprenyl phosphate-alpha-L-ara4FN deformylase